MRFELIIDGVKIDTLEGSAKECAAYIETVAKHNSTHKALQGCRFNTVSNGSVFISAKQLANCLIQTKEID